MQAASSLPHYSITRVGTKYVSSCPFYISSLRSPLALSIRTACPPAYSPTVESDETSVIPAFFSSANARCSNGVAVPVTRPIIAIPQRTADTISPFVRAYPPSLGSLYSIPRCKWFEFLDRARDYMVSELSPYLSSGQCFPDAC